MATVGTPKVEDFSKYRLTEIYCSSIADNDTVVTGIPGIKKVLLRIGTGSANVMTAPTGTILAGTSGATRRVAAFLSDAETGTVTFDAGAGGSTGVLMIYSSR